MNEDEKITQSIIEIKRRFGYLLSNDYAKKFDDVASLYLNNLVYQLITVYNNDFMNKIKTSDKQIIKKICDCSFYNVDCIYAILFP